MGDVNTGTLHIDHASIIPRLVPDGSKENSNLNSNLGYLFQQRLANETALLQPEVLNGGQTPVLSTGEDLPESVLAQVRQDPPNGYIFGAGFGNILSMSLLFNEDQPPKAILAVDVSPTVVVAGRVFSRVLAQASDFKSFISTLNDAQTIASLHHDVINSEANVHTKQSLDTVSARSLIDIIHKTFISEYVPPTGYLQRNSIDKFDRVSVLAVIREKFALLHKLAAAGNIGVGYTDLTDPKLIEIVKNMPDFTRLRNVVYMSNVVDHLTDRGKVPRNAAKLSVLRELELGYPNFDNTTFIDTTTALDYVLRAKKSLPLYTPNELQGY